VSGANIALIVLVALVVLDFAVRIVTILLLPRNRRPSSALAWLLAIFFIPFFGVLAFLLIGNYKLPAARRKKQASIDSFIAWSSGTMRSISSEGGEPAWFDAVGHLTRTLGALPVVRGNAAGLIGDYAESLAALARDIRTAQRFVHIEFYILALDDATEDVFAAMAEAVSRGVTVRVLMDHIASARTATHRATRRRLDADGVDWRYMLPVQPWRGKWQRPDLRNHRKLVVVDNRVAFMGSQNIIDRSYDKPSNLRRGLLWQDLMVRLEGPIVREVNSVFIADWYSETDELLRNETDLGVPVDLDALPGDLDCQLVPSGPGFEGENNLQLFLALLHRAERTVVITSPYFVPDEAMLLAIVGATARGVAVELFVSEIGDQAGVFHAQRSYYEALLRAGVRIRMYPGPFILHAKHVTVDESVSVIGSSNMDIRSFALDLEISLLTRGPALVEKLRAVEDGYRSISRELTLEEWMRQPRRSTIADNVARLTSGLQ
jgi:cardiolipin synthase